MARCGRVRREVVIARFGSLTRLQLLCWRCSGDAEARRDGIDGSAGPDRPTWNDYLHCATVESGPVRAYKNPLLNRGFTVGEGGLEL